MSRDASFWRNVAIIGIVHVALLSALVRWSSAPRRASASNILWMDGGAGAQAAAGTSISQTSTADRQMIESPAIEIPQTSEVDEEADTAATATNPSAIEVAPPPPRLKPLATPRATAKPTAKPSPKASPKKILLAKATSPARPKPSATPASKRDREEHAKSESSPTRSASTDVAAAIADAAKTGAAATVGISGPGVGGSGGRGVGPGGASQFGWYAHMLHDRFFSQWAQPTSVVRSGAKMATLVKLRIEKDGSVSRFTILKPSGNVVVDESVAAVSKRVTQVEPLPSGLGDSFYEVNINFELNSEQ